MADLHDIIGRLWEELEQVDFLDVVPLLARWLRVIFCHCDIPGCHDRSTGRHVVIQAVLIVQYAATWNIRKSNQHKHEVNLSPIRDPNVS